MHTTKKQISTVVIYTIVCVAAIIGKFTVVVTFNMDNLNRTRVIAGDGLDELLQVVEEVVTEPTETIADKRKPRTDYKSGTQKHDSEAKLAQK